MRGGSGNVLTADLPTVWHVTPPVSNGSPIVGNDTEACCVKIVRPPGLPEHFDELAGSRVGKYISEHLEKFSSGLCRAPPRRLNCPRTTLGWKAIATSLDLCRKQCFYG